MLQAKTMPTMQTKCTSKKCAKCQHANSVDVILLSCNNWGSLNKG